MAVGPPTDVVEALKGLSPTEARAIALKATLTYIRWRLRIRIQLRGAALESALDRARQPLRRVVALVFNEDLGVDTAAFVMQAAADALVVELRRRARGVRRGRGRPLTGQGAMARAHIVLLTLEPPARLVLLARVCGLLFDLTPNAELQDAIRGEIDAHERRRAERNRRAGLDFDVEFTAATRIRREPN